MGTFVVTAGHSNTDPGAVANGHKESDIACDMRNMIASKLRALGHKVFTDGDGKENQPLSQAIMRECAEVWEWWYTPQRCSHHHLLTFWPRFMRVFYRGKAYEHNHQAFEV